MQKRKADIEAKEREIKAKKLQTAMEVRKQREEALKKKKEYDEQYKAHVKSTYSRKMQDVDSQFSAN